MVTRMDKITTKHITDIEPYSGPQELEGIRFRPAAAALGVSAWGMNILEIDAGSELYPEHDHMGDGQEEVYVILEGQARLRIGDEERVLNKGDLTRVGPETKRKLLAGPNGVTFLAIGGTPGKAYPAKKG